MLLTILIFFRLSYCNWRLIYSNYYTEGLNSITQWDFKQSCSVNQIQSTSIKQCGTNPLEYLRLKDDRTRLEKQFYYPHHQIRILTDVIYFRSLQGVDSEFNIFLVDSSGSSSLHQRLYQQNDLQQYDKVCSNTCGGGCNTLDDRRIEIKSIALDSINHNQPIFNILSSQIKFLFQNYQKFCFQCFEAKLSLKLTIKPLIYQR